MNLLNEKKRPTNSVKILKKKVKKRLNSEFRKFRSINKLWHVSIIHFCH